MKPGVVLPVLLFLGITVVGACSSDTDPASRPSPPGPDSGKVGTKEDGGRDPEDPNRPKIETDIVLPAETRFDKRDCTVTVRWEGGGSDVKIAGEFTTPAWENGPLPMTKNGSVHEITIAPSATVEAGKIHAYKLIVDGQWKIDPRSQYRKIVGAPPQINSGFVLPTCEAGPETRSGPVAVTGSEMKVRVTLRTAADGDAVERIKASLDNDGVAAEAFAIDAASGAVDFTFAGLAKGKHTLSLRTFDRKGREAEPVDLPFWVEDEAFDWRDGVLYMMLIDRFANGDRMNDRPVGGEVEYEADWHGGDLVGALEVLRSGYFERLGVRTIWLSPLNAQTDKWHFGDGNQKYSAYHGYWPIKAREVEPRFGGGPALKSFVAEAHKRGIRVLLDLINNQVHDDHEYVAAHPDWFRKVCKCGESGCGWSEKPFECLFQPYLPDIDWNQIGAEKQFIADATSWIASYDLDGFRVDAVKHVEANSIYDMRAELARRFEQGGARIFMVGETAVGEGDSGTFFGEHFGSGYDWISAYTGPTGLDGQFDFPTRHNMADGLVNGDKPLNEVDGEIAKAEARYGASAKYHVRFLNGHDNRRIASIAAKDPKLGCRWSDGCREPNLPPLAYSDPAVYVRLKRALTVLFTMPGVPYLYQGDEVAFGGGDDPDMRRNMLFGDGLAGVEMARPGTTAPALTPSQVDLREWARKLGAARVASRALRRGDRRTLLSEGDLWVYAYQSGPKEVAIVAINRGGAVTSRTIGAGGIDLGAVATLRSALGTGSATKSRGGITLSLGAGEAAIFTAD
jgi:glycosidase